jgi:hypothetical protein
MTLIDDDDSDAFSDPTIDEIHWVRQQIWESFGGDLNAILEDARRRQAESGCETVTLEESLRLRPDEPSVGR